MIYLDSSALVKLAHPEAETEQLIGWLAARSGRFTVASKLAYAETVRALRRSDPEAVAQVPAVFLRLFRLPVDDRVLELAAGFADPMLRTLDAIHLATAGVLGAARLSFVTYDRRLLGVAAQQGYEAVAPGA